MGIFSSLFGDKKARKAQTQGARLAADAQVQGQREGIAAQERAFDESLGFITPFQQPTSVFEPGLERVRALVGGLGPEEQAAAFQNFQDSPGVAFLRERGLQGIDRDAAARGGLGGGNRLKALTDFSQGLALQDFNNQLSNLLQVSQADRSFQSGLGQGLANLRTGLGSAQAQGLANIGSAQAQGFTNVGNIKADSFRRDQSRLFSAIGGAALAPVTGGGSLLGSLFGK